MVAAMRYVRGDFDTEAEAQHFANGLKMMEQQTSLTGEQTPTAEEQETRKQAKAKAKDSLGKAEGILIPLFEELGGKKPEDLAVILGNDLDRYVRVVGKIYSQVQAVRNTLSKAQGVQRAMQAQFNKAAAEVQNEAAAAKKTEGAAKPEAAEAAKPVESKTAAKPASKTAAKPQSTARNGAVKPAPKPEARTAAGAKSPARRTPAKKTEPAAK